MTNKETPRIFNEVPEKAKDIILKALNSDKEYKEMAEKEAAVWGKFQTNKRTKTVREEDMEAIKMLNDNPDVFSFPKWCLENGLSFDKVLSVGCGEGRGERMLFNQKVIKSCHSIDISQDSLDKAKIEADTVGFPCTFEAADLNYVDLGEKKYDLIIAQTCIHHLVRLEEVFESMNKALKPNGNLWLMDYVGETQFQYSDERLAVVNEILKILPEELRKNHLNGITVDEAKRREPGTLISPFESIRSGDILSVADHYFEKIAGEVIGTLAYLTSPLGTRKNYTKSPEAIALFRLINLMDRKFGKHGILPGTNARVVYRKREL